MGRLAAKALDGLRALKVDNREGKPLQKPQPALRGTLRVRPCKLGTSRPWLVTAPQSRLRFLELGLCFYFTLRWNHPDYEKLWGNRIRH